MFLKAIQLRRPELRDEVHALIARVHNEHPGVQLPLGEMVRLMGLRVAPEFQTQLNSRGLMLLGEDVFLNEGPEIRRPVVIKGLEAQLHMPIRLAGELERYAGAVQLSFLPEASIGLSRFPFQITLRHLDINHERIRVEVRGAQDFHISLD